MRRAIVVVVCLLLIAPEVSARDLGDWKNVTRLKRGTSVLVSLWNGDQLEGRLESVSDTGLSVGSPDGTRANAQWSEAVERGSVRRVVRWRGRGDLPDPGKVMIIGTTAGFAAGAIAGGIQDATGRNQGRGITYGLAGGVLGFFGSCVVLTGIGAVSLGRGPRRTEVVYEVKASGQPRDSSGPTSNVQR